ncbi:cytochrome c oxidase subunit 1 [Dinochytrium kinnereticum]|nr:cytochrome c oxidase subunit 1 [Dinochytrium kinnereticum]
MSHLSERVDVDLQAPKRLAVGKTPSDGVGKSGAGWGGGKDGKVGPDSAGRQKKNAVVPSSGAANTDDLQPDAQEKKSKPWSGVLRAMMPHSSIKKENSSFLSLDSASGENEATKSSSPLRTETSNLRKQHDNGSDDTSLESPTQGLRSWYKKYKSTEGDNAMNVNKLAIPGNGNVSSDSISEGEQGGGSPRHSHFASSTMTANSLQKDPSMASRHLSVKGDVSMSTTSRKSITRGTPSSNANTGSVATERSVTVQHNPMQMGGVLAYGKWNALTEADIDFAEAGKRKLGSVEVSGDGIPRLVVDISNLSKGEIKRQEVIFELILTEKEYIRDLNIIINLFLLKIREKSVLQPRQVSIVFSNIEQLLPVNQELMQRLQERRRESFGIVLQVGDIFLAVAQYLKMYTIYCGNQPEALAFLKAQKGNSELNLFLQYCFLRPDCRGLDIGGFLLKPVQRICKYPLLLKELLKHTAEDHPDHENLKNAFDLINSVVDTVNERRRFVENQQKMLSAVAKLDFDKYQLVHEPSRRFVMEGGLTRYAPHSIISTTQQRWAVLLSDCFILARTGILSGKMQVTRIAHASKICASDVPETEKYPFSFEVSVGDKKNYHFMTLNADLKRQWILNINETANSTNGRLSFTQAEKAVTASPTPLLQTIKVEKVDRQESFVSIAKRSLDSLDKQESSIQVAGVQNLGSKASIADDSVINTKSDSFQPVPVKKSLSLSHITNKVRKNGTGAGREMDLILPSKSIDMTKSLDAKSSNSSSDNSLSPTENRLDSSCDASYGSSIVRKSESLRNQRDWEASSNEAQDDDKEDCKKEPKDFAKVNDLTTRDPQIAFSGQAVTCGGGVEEDERQAVKTSSSISGQATIVAVHTPRRSRAPSEDPYVIQITGGSFKAPMPPAGPVTSSPKIRRHRTVSASTASSSDGLSRDRWACMKYPAGASHQNGQNALSMMEIPNTESSTPSSSQNNCRKTPDTGNADAATISSIPSQPKPTDSVAISPAEVKSDKPVNFTTGAIKPVPPPKPPEVRSIRTESARKRHAPPPATLPKPLSLSAEKLSHDPSNK